MEVPFILGWEEWVALPDLGLPAIKAKVDTGARTSALHARLIEPFGPVHAPMVRFAVNPAPGREDIEVICSSRLVDRREVISSNGDRENRFVIEERIQIGKRVWPIEITLTNRASMSYRMLLGRQAIQEDMAVEPASSFRQPKLSYKPYRRTPQPIPVRRALRLGVLTRNPDSATTRNLRRAAEVSGHVLETLDPTLIAMTFAEGVPGLTIAGLANPHYDAIIPRARRQGRRSVGSLIRQFDLMGSFTLNTGEALDRVRTPVAVWQTLTRVGIPASPPLETTTPGATASLDSQRPFWRIALLGGRALATIAWRDGRFQRVETVLESWPESRPEALEEPQTSQDIATRAAAALDLGLLSIDIGPGKDDHAGGRLAVLGISVAPHLARMETLTGVAVARDIIRYVESHVRSTVMSSSDPS